MEITLTHYHDFVAMNHKEVVYDPTPEDQERLLREGLVDEGDVVRIQDRV